MKALLGAIGVIGIAGIVAAHLYGQKIEASIDQDGLARACPPSSPIFVRVRNWSFNTVKSVNFSMEVYKNARSHNLLTHSNYLLDYVIEPFSSRTGCYSDDYTDSLIVKGTPPDTSSQFVKINTADLIKEVNAAREFSLKHAVYITNVNYEMIN